MYVLFFSRNPADFRNFVSYLLCLQNVNEKIYVNNSVLYFNSMRQENERKKKNKWTSGAARDLPTSSARKLFNSAFKLEILFINELKIVTSNYLTYQNSF